MLFDNYRKSFRMLFYGQGCRADTEKRHPNIQRKLKENEQHGKYAVYRPYINRLLQSKQVRAKCTAYNTFTSPATGRINSR
jgi:hypothetical protein